MSEDVAVEFTSTRVNRAGVELLVPGSWSQR